MYSLFGYYPWRCTLCNTDGMYRGRLEPEREAPHAPADDLGNA
ncbi:hypothetical protein [Occallatibacter riparius]|nr:hypothetical protein [Occallatibacter riparius]